MLIDKTEPLKRGVWRPKERSMPPRSEGALKTRQSENVEKNFIQTWRREPQKLSPQRQKTWTAMFWLSISSKILSNLICGLFLDREACKGVVPMITLEWFPVSILSPNSTKDKDCSSRWKVKNSIQIHFYNKYPIKI